MSDFNIEIGAKLTSNAFSNIEKELKSKKNLSLKIDKLSIGNINTSEIEKQIEKSIRNAIKNTTITTPTPSIQRSSTTSSRINSNTTSAEIERINKAINNMSFDAKIAQLKAGFMRAGDSAKDAAKNIEAVTKAYNNLKDPKQVENLITNHKILNDTIAKTQNKLKITTTEARQYVDTLKVSKLNNIIELWLKKNTAATDEAIAQMKVYQNMLNGNNIEQTVFKKVSNGYDDINTKMRAQGKLGKSFSSSLTEMTKKFSTLGLTAAATMKVFSETKEALSTLKEVDTYLTEISKANDKLSKSDLKQIGNNSFDIASKYGKEATSYLSGIQEASRAGYENAEGIAELSVAAQGAGDMSAELANSYIVATDKAYKMNGSVSALTETLDGANNITNNNAVNMTELADGMSIVGSQAASSQMRVNETTAAIGTLIATTQKSGSEMGNAFKGILMNLQQVTGEVEDGEGAIDETSLTKYEKACKELGVSLSTVKDGVVSLKEPMQILKQLSEEYTKLDKSDAKRANLLSAVGGKYRANALNAILENYDTYEKMLQDYTDGKGSMAEEAEKTANSWEGSMNRLSNTWTSVISNIADSDAITTGINALNGLLGVVNDLTSSLGSLGTLGLGAGLFAGIQNVGRDKMFSLICFEYADNNMCSLGY